MKIQCQTAVVSLCRNLTRVDGLSIPIAVVVLGTDGGSPYAALEAIVGIPDVDELTADVLSDVPELVKDHIDAAIHQLGDHGTFPQVLNALHQKLRNSIHVSRIGELEEIEVEAEEPSKIADSLSAKARQTLLESLEETLALTQKNDTEASWAPQKKPRPTRFAWPLPPYFGDNRQSAHA